MKTTITNKSRKRLTGYEVFFWIAFVICMFVASELAQRLDIGNYSILGEVISMVDDGDNENAIARIEELKAEYPDDTEIIHQLDELYLQAHNGFLNHMYQAELSLLEEKLYGDVEKVASVILEYLATYHAIYGISAEEYEDFRSGALNSILPTQDMSADETITYDQIVDNSEKVKEVMKKTSTSETEQSFYEIFTDTIVLQLISLEHLEDDSPGDS